MYYDAPLAKIIGRNESQLCFSFRHVARITALDGVGIVVGHGFCLFAAVEAEHALGVLGESLVATLHGVAMRRGGIFATAHLDYLAATVP